MIVCQNCGAENEVGRTVCLECGHALQTQEPQPGGTGEIVPDWLELLFAKYGEQAPNIIVSPAAPASVTAQEGLAEKGSTSSPGWSQDEVDEEVPAVLEEEEEIPDWLTNLSAGEATVAPSPSSSEPVAVSGTEETPPIVDEQQKAVTDWLAALRQIDAETREKPAPETVVEEVPAIVQDDKGEIPSWLRELGEVTQTEEFVSSTQPKPEFAQPEVADQDEGEIPAWLDRLITGPGEEDEPPGQVEDQSAGEQVPALFEPTGSSEVPDRLAEEADAAEPGSEESPLPVWLAEFGISEIESEASPEQGADTGEFPDWLRELETETAAVSPVEESPPEKTVPMDVEPPAGAEANLSTPGVETQQVEEAVPDWLVDLRVLEATETGAAAEEASLLQAEPPLEEIPVAGEESVQVHPEWLADLESIAEQAQVVETAQFEQAESASAAAAEDEEDIPDWLRQIAAETADETTERSRSQPTEPPAIEGLAPAEIPEWIAQLKPADMPPGEQPEPEMPDSEEESAVESLRSKLAIPEAPDVAGAELFEKITDEQQDSTPPGGQETTGKGHRLIGTLVWTFVFLVLIIAIVISLLAVVVRVQELLGATAFQEYLESPSAAGLVTTVTTFRQQVSDLSPNQVVVVSIDYTPATAAEMEPLAEAVVGDLLSRQARVVTVSLRPEGAAMAQRLLDRFDEDYAYGERSLNLGYLPGQTAGVRSLSGFPDVPLFARPENWREGNTAWSDHPAWQDVERLENVVMVVEIADNVQMTRWWIEQTTPSVLAQRPMLVATSAAALPGVRPYYSPAEPTKSQLSGLIGGVMAAATYEILLGQPGKATGAVAAQSVAHVGLVFFCLVGTFAGFRSQLIAHTDD